MFQLIQHAREFLDQYRPKICSQLPVQISPIIETNPENEVRVRSNDMLTLDFHRCFRLINKSNVKSTKYVNDTRKKLKNNVIIDLSIILVRNK